MKRIISILLSLTLVFSVFAVIPPAASAATAKTYVYSKTLNIPFYDEYGRSATFHAAVPKLRNISGPDVETMQKNLDKCYQYEKGRADYLYKEKFSFQPKMSYTAYLYGNILSILIKCNNHDLYAYSMYAYSINVKTGKIINRTSGILKNTGLSVKKAKSLALNAIKRDLESGKSRSQKYFSQYGAKFYQKIVKGMDKKLYYFYDASGNLMMLYYDWWKWDGQFVGYSLACKIKNRSAMVTSTYPKVTTLKNVKGGIRIAWKKVSGAAKYRLFYKNGSGWKRFGGDGTVTSCTINQLTSGQKYTFTVRAVGKNGKYIGTYNKKGWSITYYAAPTLVSLKTIDNGLQLEWKLVKGVKKYRIFRKVNGGAWKKFYDTTDASHRYLFDGTVQKGNTYSYTVRCLSSDGKKYISGYDTKGKSIGY